MGFPAKSGYIRVAPVRLRFGGGTVRANPVFGSGGSSLERFFFFFLFLLQQKEAVLVPVSVPEKRFRRFRFRVRFLARRFRRFQFPFGSGSVPGPPCYIIGHYWSKSTSLSGNHWERDGVFFTYR